MTAKRYTEKQRARAKSYWEKKMPTREIAEKMGCHINSILSWIRGWKKEAKEATIESPLFSDAIRYATAKFGIPSESRSFTVTGTFTITEKK